MGREPLIRAAMAFINHERAAVLLGSAFDIQAHIFVQRGFEFTVIGPMPTLTLFIMAIPLKNPGTVLGFSALDIQALATVVVLYSAFGVHGPPLVGFAVALPLMDEHAILLLESRHIQASARVVDL